jgi:hypothetical protein
MDKKPEYNEKMAAILKTANQAVKKALLHHKAIGNTIVYSKDGKIVYEKLSMDSADTSQ